MESLLIALQSSTYDTIFVVLMLVVGLVLSLQVIPYTTDVMVNAAAGLAGKYLGNRSRTLVINCSTNNPELITMLLALFLSGTLGIGGIATPLGSNFANIYLMFLVGLPWVLLTFRIRDPQKYHHMRELLRREWKLVVWHTAMSISMFVIARLSFNLLPNTTSARGRLLTIAGLCIAGVAIYLWRERKLQQQRPELFEDIDDEDHVASWTNFVVGTTGLMFACYVVNAMFLASTKLYGDTLSIYLGANVFNAMHFFLGALITSLPELTVAVANYKRVTSADLNTGLASASASNMSNLGIAAIGALIACCLAAPTGSASVLP